MTGSLPRWGVNLVLTKSIRGPFKLSQEPSVCFSTTSKANTQDLLALALAAAAPCF